MTPVILTANAQHPGLAHLSAMDRHVIANMGAELGAITTVFPVDDAVRIFLRAEAEATTSPSWSLTRTPSTTSPTRLICPRCNR